MTIRDVNSAYKIFGKLEGGELFRLEGQYYCKLCESVHLTAGREEKTEMYNAVNLYDGDVCSIGDEVHVETLAGHTLEILD